MVQGLAQQHQKEKQGMVKGKDKVFRFASLLPWVLNPGRDFQKRYQDTGWLCEAGRQGTRYILKLSAENWQLKPQEISVQQNKKRK